MDFFLSSPRILCWFDYIQKSLTNNIYDTFCCYRSCCFLSVVFYFYHLILFSIVSSKISLLGSVDIMVIYDIAEWQIMIQMQWLGAHNLSLVFHFKSCLQGSDSRSVFPSGQPSQAGDAVLSMLCMDYLETILKAFGTEISLLSNKPSIDFPSV